MGVCSLLVSTAACPKNVSSQLRIIFGFLSRHLFFPAEKIWQQAITMSIVQ